MICEHGNTAPCVECDIEPLKVENESLQKDISVLVEALSALRACIMETRGPDAYSALLLADAALAAYQNQGEDQ